MKIRTLVIAAALAVSVAEVQAQQTGSLDKGTLFCTEDYFLDYAFEHAANQEHAKLELMMEYNMCGLTHGNIPYQVLLTKTGETGLEYAQIESTTATGPVYGWVLVHSLK